MKCKKYFTSYEKFREYREKYKTRYRAKTGSGRYQSRPWTKEELRLVVKHSIPDRELSIKIERSVAAIQNARYRVKVGEYTI